MNAWTESFRGEEIGPPKFLRYWGILTAAGDPISFYHTPIESYLVGPWLDGHRLIGHLNKTFGLMPDSSPTFFGNVPAVVDLESALISPIPQPFLDQKIFRRNNVVGVQHGPFARVVNTGDCLNVRASPSAGAGILRCYVDGVLLQDLGETRESGGTTWARVKAPGGLEGWASVEYLER
jgi:hypothetical protein